MNYQIIISDKVDKIKSVRLQTHIPIQDAVYWQERIGKFILDLKLNEHATVAIAQRQLSRSYYGFDYETVKD